MTDERPLLLKCTAVVFLALPLLVTCSAKSATTCSQYEDLPDMYLMKRGYDIVFGDPSSEIEDPGFKSNIFEFFYNATPPVDCYRMPEKYEGNTMHTCNYNSETAIMSSTSSFQQAVSVGVTISGGGAGTLAALAKFTGSAGYQKSKSEIVNKGHTWVWQRAKCATYNVVLQSWSSAQMTEEFKQAVKDMDAVTINEKLKDFVAKYGTHYVVGMTMGAQLRYESLFEYCRWKEMNEAKVNIGLGAGASFNRALGLTAGVNMSYADKFESYRTTSKKVNNGPPPEPNEEPDIWHGRIKAKPRSIAITLRPLTDLITGDNFGEVGNIKSIRKAMEEYILRMYESHKPSGNGTYNPNGNPCDAAVDRGNRLKATATLLLIMRIFWSLAYL